MKAGVDYVVTIPLPDVWNDAFSCLPMPLLLAVSDTMQILWSNQAATAYLAVDPAAPLVLSELFNPRIEAYTEWMAGLAQPQIPPLDLLLSRSQPPATVRVYTTRLEQAGRIYLLLSLIDISDKCDQIQRLEQLAAHDDLTGLLNRRFFREQLAAALPQAKADGQACYLAYMDLDAFGHSEGDWYITTVTSLLRKLLRPVDIAGRVGGDEFAVLFRRCPRIHAEQTIWKLQR